ncbi:hypothetical protein [Streptomyces nigrescens]
MNITTERCGRNARRIEDRIRELWLRVADAGSLMDTSWVRGALEGGTELSDKGYVRNAFKLPAHVRDALPAHVTQD